MFRSINPVIAFLLLLLTARPLLAQPTEDDNVYTSVELMPIFPGGDAALTEYIITHFNVPKPAQEAGISGKVLVGFTVDKEGHVTDVKVERGLGFGIDEEAVRVVKTLPAFVPGEQNGKKVKVRYAWPIKISLKEIADPGLPPIPKPGDYTVKNGDTVFTNVEQMPRYPGGDAALLNHIRNNLVIPYAAKQAGVNGKLFVSFTVSETGQVTNIGIEKGLGYGLNEEAIRVISRLKQFEPGLQEGKPVKVRYVWPIKITLSNPTPVRRR